MPQFLNLSISQYEDLLMAEFKLPQLTESNAAVKLASWLKKEGDAVTKGEPIAEVETDKTNVEIEAPESGVLQKIHVQAGGDPVTPGTVIATIGAGDGAKAASAPKAVPASKPEPVAAKSTSAQSTSVDKPAAPKPAPVAPPAPALVATHAPDHKVPASD